MNFTFSYTSEWNKKVAIWFRYAVAAFYSRNNPNVPLWDVMLIVPRMRAITEEAQRECGGDEAREKWKILWKALSILLHPESHDVTDTTWRNYVELLMVILQRHLWDQYGRRARRVIEVSGSADNVAYEAAVSRYQYDVGEALSIFEKAYEDSIGTKRGKGKRLNNESLEGLQMPSPPMHLIDLNEKTATIAIVHKMSKEPIISDSSFANYSFDAMFQTGWITDESRGCDHIVGDWAEHDTFSSDK